MGSGTMVVAVEAIDFRDVLNPIAFVHATITRSRRLLGPEEREELAAEGMAILCKLARDFEPQIDGYECAGRFSGFAAKYLPLKLEDAYHRLHPEHLLQTQEDGSRRYHYGERPVSLEALSGEDGEQRQLGAREDAERPSPSIRQMLADQYEQRLDCAMRVAGLLGEGLTSDREIADVLGLTVGQVRDARQDLEPIAQRLRTLSQR